MRVRFGARAAGTRPRPAGTRVAVSEMPSWASRYGILATDAAAAWMPWLSRPCMGFAPGADGSPRRRPSGVIPVGFPEPSVDWIGSTDWVWRALRYVGYLRSVPMKVRTNQEAM